MTNERAVGDPRPPIVCDMSAAPDTPAERQEEYRRLFGGYLIGRERSDSGITFRFRADPGLHEWITDLSAREQACCPFFVCAVHATEREVRWDVSVIDDDLARLVLAEFYGLPDILTGERAGAGAPRQGGG